MGEKFQGGSLLQQLPERPHFLREPLRAHRCHKPLQSFRKAHEDFDPIREKDRINHRRGLGDDLQALDPRLGRIDAIIAEVISQFTDLEEFDRITSLPEIFLSLFLASRRRSALKQEIGQLEVDGSDRLAE